MAEFSTAYPGPYPFALGQRSPFTDDPAEVKRLSREAKVLHWRGSQTHQVGRDSSGDQRIRAIYQGTTDKQHHCYKLDKNGKCELPERLLTGDITQPMVLKWFNPSVAPLTPL